MATQLWTVDAPVLVIPPQLPLACRMLLASYPPKGGSGVRVHGFDVREVRGTTSYGNGTLVTPTLHLTGTYDGDHLTLTAVPTPVEPTAPAVPHFDTACDDPGNGASTDDERHAATDYARAQQDLGAIWFSDHSRILNVTFTGDLDGHRQAIRARYPGPLCVARAEITARTLKEIGRRVQDDKDLLAARGIRLLQWGPSLKTFEVLVVAATRAQIDGLEEQYGPGVVVTSWLRQAPEIRRDG